MDGCRITYRFFFINAINIIFLVVSLNARADLVNNEWYSSAHALGMGNTGISNADDPETEMFYNPALLAKNKKTVVEFLNPHQEIGLGNFAIGNSTADLLQQSHLRLAVPMLQSHPGKASSFDGSIYPYFSTQNFSLGFLMRGDASSYFGKNSTLFYHSRYLVVPTMGLSMGTFSGRVKFGSAVRGVQLTDNDVSTTSLTNLGYQTNAKEGFGIALDAGTAITLPWDSLPTVGLVARNIGGTSFPASAPFLKFASGKVAMPGMIKSTYDAGASFSPKVARKTTLTLAMDYRDVLNKYKVSTLRRVNAGAEFGFNKFFFVRLGESRGYWTAAVGISGKKATLDIGTYADELDKTGFRVQTDRRLFFRYGGKF